jgi:hypothetical protein
MDPLLIVLSYTNFYVELQYLNILKYSFNLIRFILKLLLFFKRYPIICRFFYGWDVVGALVHIYCKWIPSQQRNGVHHISRSDESTTDDLEVQTTKKEDITRPSMTKN